MLMRSAIFTTGLSLALLAFVGSPYAADGVATRDGTLRAGPATSYPSVALVSAGDDLQIYGCLDGYSWCDVSVDDERGWLRGSRIAFLRGGNRLSIAENYSSFGLGVVTFGLGAYWGQHYDRQPWFGDRRWRRGADALPPEWRQSHGNRPTIGDTVGGQNRRDSRPPVASTPRHQHPVRANPSPMHQSAGQHKRPGRQVIQQHRQTQRQQRPVRQHQQAPRMHQQRPPQHQQALRMHQQRPPQHQQAPRMQQRAPQQHAPRPQAPAGNRKCADGKC